MQLHSEMSKEVQCVNLGFSFGVLNNVMKLSPLTSEQMFAEGVDIFSSFGASHASLDTFSQF